MDITKAPTLSDALASLSDDELLLHIKECARVLATRNSRNGALQILVDTLYEIELEQMTTDELAAEQKRIEHDMMFGGIQ